MARITAVLCCGAMLAFAAWAQQSTDENGPPPQTKAEKQKHKSPGAAHDVGSGAGNIGTGVAKGAGDAAKGAGKGAVDLVTLHPIDAAGSVGKGAVDTGKDVTVGTAKGTGKMVRGVGKVFKKIF
jgi:hypothetical protein